MFLLVFFFSKRKVRKGFSPLRALYLKSLVILSVSLSLVLTSACRKAEAPKARPPVPVVAADASKKDVPVTVGAIGNVEAYSTVSVKSMVAGQIMRVYFKEGQDVRKGDNLFLIDPRPAEEALRQAKANLAKDIAQEKNAETEAARYAELYKRGIVSKEQYEQFRTNAETLAATVNADRAAAENAGVTLGYTKITSPIDGRTGNLNVHEGNIVKENDTPYLVVINQVTPIYVTFSVPQQYLMDIKKYMAQGKLAVTASAQGDDKSPAEGVLTFVDNAVDPATGTIKLKGTFLNSDLRLWPGQFVEVSLRLTSLPGATVVPAQAVQTGQKGQYVFVIKPDMTVEDRPVQPGITLKGETVIDKGIRPGERVVTDGQLRLVPGAKVEVKPGL
jgi:multidrug efflux system membrane fusion protein